MKIITSAVIKGGTGKSTTAAALAQAAAADGKRVLAIDLDPQANFTFFVGADQNRPGSYQLLHGEDPAGLIQRTEQGIFAISASPDLATEKTTPGSANRLQAAILPLEKQFDFVFLDTPAAMGELNLNALQASTGLLIPLETDTSSLQGLYQITDIAHQLQRSNPGLKILGSVLTRFDRRANYNKYLQKVIADTGNEIGTPFLMGIRPCIQLKEAQGLQQSLFQYAPRSNAAHDYRKLYELIREA